MGRFRDPAPDRIVTSDTKLESRIHHKFLELYFEGKIIQLEERDKTPQEEMLISQVDFLVTTELEKMGVKTKLFSRDKIRFFTPSSRVRLEDWEVDTAGTASMLSQEIEIVAEKDDYFLIASVLVHELIHIHQFLSSIVATEPDQENVVTVKARRLGLEFINQSENDESLRSFRYLNEALTEILTMIMLKNNSTQIEILKDYSFDDHFFTSYVDEKILACSLITKLQNANPDIFPEFNEAANIFFRSMFTGQTLELARIIEKTFGKGSFREIGERFSKRPVVIDDILARADS